MAKDEFVFNKDLVKREDHEGENIYVRKDVITERKLSDQRLVLPTIVWAGDSFVPTVHPSQNGMTRAIAPFWQSTGSGVQYLESGSWNPMAPKKQMTLGEVVSKAGAHKVTQRDIALSMIPIVPDDATPKEKELIDTPTTQETALLTERLQLRDKVKK